MFLSATLYTWGGITAMGSRVLEAVESEKDVGLAIHKSLKPSFQCARAASKSNLVLGQLARAVTK